MLKVSIRGMVFQHCSSLGAAETCLTCAGARDRLYLKALDINGRAEVLVKTEKRHSLECTTAALGLALSFDSIAYTGVLSPVHHAEKSSWGERKVV